MRFSITDLLAIVALVAVALGGLTFLHRSFAPNPDSEQFTLCGNEFTPNWKVCERKQLNRTVVSSMSPIESPGGYKATPWDVEIDQQLFHYRYSDHFGADTYRISYSLTGHSDSNWNDFYLLPDVTGGGNVDASAEVTSEFCARTRVVTVHIHQQFASTPTAKHVKLHFRWDGSRFVGSDDTEQCDEPKSR